MSAFQNAKNQDLFGTITLLAVSYGCGTWLLTPKK